MDNKNQEYKITLKVAPPIVYPFEYRGLRLFAHRHYDVFGEWGEQWRVSEFTTGSYIAGTFATKEEAIKQANARLDSKSPEYIEKALEYIENYKKFTCFLADKGAKDGT